MPEEIQLEGFPLYGGTVVDAIRHVADSLKAKNPRLKPYEVALALDAIATAAPEWPSRVEAVEIAKLDLKPGDTLIVKAKDGSEFGPYVSEELREFLKCFLPDVEIIVIGLPVDLEVRTAAEDGA